MSVDVTNPPPSPPLLRAALAVAWGCCAGARPGRTGGGPHGTGRSWPSNDPKRRQCPRKGALLPWAGAPACHGHSAPRPRGALGRCVYTAAVLLVKWGGAAAGSTAFGMGPSSAELPQ